MKLLSRFLILAIALVPIALLADTGGKKATPLQETIREYKSRGEAVPRDVLRAAQSAYSAKSTSTAAALRAALTDGGSSSANATIVTSNPYVDSGNTTGKGNNAAIPPCASGGSDDADDAWYRLDLAFPSDVTVWTTCESSGPPSYDTRLGIFDNALALVTCNDDSPDCGAPYYQSRISSYPLPAGTYYIVVDGYGGDSGPYELNVTWVVTSGACMGGSDASNADVVGAMPFVDANTTEGACHNYTLDCELGGAADAPDYWYRVSLDTTVFMDVWTTCDAGDIDTRIAVVDTNLNQVYCNDDDPGCPSGQSSIVDAFLFPGEYFVIVEGADTTSGTYEIHIDTTVVHPDSGNVLLPDIIVRESDLYDHDISTEVEPGRTHLRLSNGTANIGDGKLYIYGTGVDNGDGTENIIQRIFIDGGTFLDRTAGFFVFHEQHNHIHVDDWGEYRLREVLPNNGVGNVVAKGRKTSFCILDLSVYDSGLPNYNPDGEFFSCASTIQGLSVGWVDVYSKGLPDQNIDITDVPAGTYWLESEVDPNNWFMEKDETNNIARIKVTIGGGAAIDPDPYEPNDTTTAVDGRPPGGPNSPNLGPCNPQRVITGLTVHVADYDDYFKFYANETGGVADFVSVDFDTAEGNLDIQLLDSLGAVVDSSVSVTDTTETIYLTGHPEGWYYVRVFSPSAALISDYTLTVDPPENTPPSVTVLDPASGTEFIIQGQETYTVTWDASDPEGDQTWATVYANTAPTFDGSEILLPTSVNTPGEQGFYVVNSAYLGFDTYWFYVELTDGGSTTGAWSDGNVKLLDIASGVDDTPEMASRLYPAVPNPFNPTTTLRVDLARRSFVVWRIYDVRGRLVRELHRGDLAAGPHSLVWNGADDRGRPVASGVYFQRVVAGDFRQTSKLVLLK